MSTTDGLTRLIYRGNFSLRRRHDFGEALQTARFGGGYMATAVIGDVSGLRSWQLQYTALTPSPITFPNGTQKTRLEYVYDFFCTSKMGGNVPFVLTDPMTGKDFLCFFPDDAMDIQMMDYKLSTTGLNIEQINAVGVNTLEDGSLGEAGNNAEI